MGVKLIVEVMEYAPDTLSAKELYAATVFAEDANDGTRMIWSGIESPKFLRRLRVKRARLYQLLDGLVAKGVLEMASAGHKYGRAKYRFPQFAGASHDQCPEDLDTETQSPENLDTDHGLSVQEPQTLKHDQCLEDLDLSVYVPWTPTPPSPSFDGPPLPPPPPESPPWLVTGEEAEEEFTNKEDPKLQTRAEAFANKLPYDRRPSRSEQTELVRLAVLALAAGWSEEDLQAECERALDGVRNRIGVWIKARLNPEELGAPPKGKSAPATADGSRPKCWRCDWSRTLRSDQGSCDCPFCSLPAGASSAEEEALWMKAQAIGIEKAGVYRADGTFMRWPPAPVPKPRTSNEHRGWHQVENPVYGRPTRPSRGSYQNPTDNSGYHEPL